MDTRRGQALVELAIGMFAVALVIGAISLFTVFIARSLREQNAARGPSPEPAEPVEVDAFSESYFAGRKTLESRERVQMPPNYILQ